MPPDEPPGIDALGDDDLPPEELEPGCDGMPDGSDELPPELPPEGDGMLGIDELRPPPPPELPPELPEEPPDEPPLEDGGEDDGDGIDEDCWLAQPPMSSAEIALTDVTYAAPTMSRFSEGRVFIMAPSVPFARETSAARAAKTLRPLT